MIKKFNFLFLFTFQILFNCYPGNIDSLENILLNEEGVQRIEILLDLSAEYTNIDPEKAIQYAREALIISQENDLSSFEARATYDLGFAYYLNNDYENAILYLENAITLRKKFDDNKGLGIANNRLGNTYQLKGEYETALEYYKEALRLNEIINDKKEIARSLTNLGSIYRIYGIYEKAIEYDLKALKFYEEVNYQDGMGWILLNIARLYKEMFEYEKALNNTERSYEIYQKIASSTGNKTGITLCLNEFASVYYNSGNFEKALDYSQQVLKINEETGNKHGIANSIAEIGKIYFDQKKFSMALAFLKQAEDLKKQINDNAGLATIYRFIGNTYVALGDLKNGKNYILNSIKIAEEQNLRNDLKESYSSLANLYSQMNDYQNALKYQNLYSQLKDSLNVKAITKLEMQYEFDKKQRQQEFERIQEEERHKAEIQRQKIIKNSFIIGFILMILLAFFIFKNYREKKRSNIELKSKNEAILQQKEEIESQRDEIERQKNIAEQQRDQIQHQNKVITDSIRYAKRIQTAVLPTTEVLDKNVSDYFILYKPRDIVSGDFYWLSEIDEKIIIAVSDCTGHGVPGAFMSMMGITFLNEIANKNEINEPYQVLDNLRSSVIKSLHQTGEYGESKDGMDMALIVIDKMKSEIQFAGANSPLFVIRNSKLIEYKPDRMPIGIHILGEAEAFKNYSFKYKKGDLFYMFSDGYIDQFGGEKGMKLMYKPFRELLIKNHTKPLAEQKELLDQNFESWRGKFNQIDDVLILGIKI